MNFKQIKEDIYALYEECLDRRTPFHKKLDLFIVPEYIVNKVFEATGVNIRDHWVCIDNFGILHTLQQHGNPLSEAKRGQIAIDKEDFIRYLEVFLYPDQICLSGYTKRTNLPLIQFVKTIDNKKFVVKEIRTIHSSKKKKLSRIVFHTMYKMKATQL